MNTLTENELLEVNGGGIGELLYKMYADTLNKIEQNPQDYTWTMDWYYQRGQTK